ncbi:NETI motif-containing protein [Chryseomicrobium sp. FSL W7-1435]|uniref:NETI motif-containing protein n=1 Tax=Chryseomicrobium sp. FSL W7-1435 TaxID=2921704 RepID=UPI00315AF48F
MKKQWVAVNEQETVAAAYDRLQQQGYQIVGRREVPVFEEVKGEPVPVRQQIEFCVIEAKDER